MGSTKIVPTADNVFNLAQKHIKDILKVKPNGKNKKTKLESATKMNLNSDTFIKQEFLTDEDLVNSITSSDLHIPIKNEPISDESLSPVTIQNEPLSASTFVDGTVAIKTENQQFLPAAGNNFVVYELETPPVTHKLTALHEQHGEQIFKAIPPSTPQTQKSNISQSKQTMVTENPSAVSNLSQSQVENITTSLPVLLNSQLRKRHRVVLPVNPIDKRTRYNIEGTTASPLDKTSVTVDSIKSTEGVNECRQLNTGIKKIINHLIRYKRNKRKLEDCAIKESPTISRIPDDIDIENIITATTNNQSLSPNSSNHISQGTKNTQIPISSAKPSINKNVLNSPIQSVDPPPITSELRVKCLCSLIDDTTTGNFELKPFFSEMFEETRRLSKTKQRNVKMCLLKAISDAEELIEQGKCCDFL